MPQEIISELKERKIDFVETEDLKEAGSRCDLIYMTRIQKERFEDLSEYERVKGAYVINEDFLKGLEKENHHSAPPSKGRRDQSGSGYVSGSCLFQAGQERGLCAHGPARHGTWKTIKHESPMNVW